MYDTFRAMGDMVHEGNGTVSIAVFGPEVRSFIEKDPELLKMLDTRNAYFGRIEPGKADLQRGTEHIGTLPNGVELYCYMGQYRETLKGAAANYIPKGKILVGSPKLLRAMFGPVAQVEKEGELPKIYAKEEVPFRYSKTGGQRDAAPDQPTGDHSLRRGRMGNRNGAVSAVPSNVPKAPKRDRRRRNRITRKEVHNGDFCGMARRNRE